MMNGTDEFGGPTAVTVSRPPAQVQREPATMPPNSYPPPNVHQQSEMFNPSGWPDPPLGMNVGSPQPQMSNPYMQNQMMGQPMMNPMMQQMMMMQQQMNPMMQQQMSGDSQTGRTPPIQ